MVLTNLLFNVCRLIWCCSGQDAGVGEAGLEQGDDHKYEEDSSNNRYAAGQVFDQEGTAVIWDSHRQREDELQRNTDHNQRLEKDQNKAMSHTFFTHQGT